MRLVFAATLAIMLVASGCDYNKLVAKAKTDLSTGHYEEALVESQNAIKADPSRWEAYLIAGAALQALKQFDTAVDNYTKALERAPEPEKVTVRNDLEQCICEKLGAAPCRKEGQQIPTKQSQQIKDYNAYLNAYVNAVRQTNPQQKAQALETFLQAYPDGAMNLYAAEELMAAYQQAGDAQRTIETANRVLRIDPNDVRALALLAYNSRAAASQGSPEMQNLDKAQHYGEKGLQAVQNMKKPDGMSDADFTKLRNEYNAIFEGSVGYAALQKKDYTAAQKDFRSAVGHEVPPSIQDIYPLATADLESRPMNPEGFWVIVKASQLAQGAGQQQILNYGREKYLMYHGSEEGWDALVKNVKGSDSVLPPSGFKVAAAN